jgi:hypothetical protein
MMERWIKPLGDGWADKGVEEAIEGWERASGLRLPDDYRAFMVRYDGGRVYPLMFRHTAREPDDAPNPTEHFVDPLYDWDHVVAWREDLGDRVPAQCLVIGADPGLIELILSLRQDDHGHVYSWVRNLGGPWSSPGNDYLCPQAPSFRDFIASLSDNEDQDGYEHWRTPGALRMRRPLEV